MRVLLVGGGCRGLGLARGLTRDGHAVRIVTRDGARRSEIEEIGAECWIGDPDRIGSIRYALENVTVIVWALGTATGDDAEKVEALHGSRLTMLLERTIDTTVRGLLYEAAGTVSGDVLARGGAEVERMCTYNEVPFALLAVDPSDREAWAAAARAAIDDLLTRARG